jgi:hypothetical protein
MIDLFELFKLATVLLGYLTGFFFFKAGIWEVALALFVAWLIAALAVFYVEAKIEEEALGDYE